MSKKVIILRGKKMALTSLTFFGGAKQGANKVTQWLLPSELKTKNAYEARFGEATFAGARSEPAIDEGLFTVKQRIKEFGDALVARMKVNPETVDSAKKNLPLGENKSGLLTAAASKSKGLGLDFVKEALDKSNLVIPGL